MLLYSKAIGAKAQTRTDFYSSVILHKKIHRSLLTTQTYEPNYIYQDLAYATCAKPKKAKILSKNLTSDSSNASVINAAPLVSRLRDGGPHANLVPDTERRSARNYFSVYRAYTAYTAQPTPFHLTMGQSLYTGKRETIVSYH